MIRLAPLLLCLLVVAAGCGSDTTPATSVPSAPAKQATARVEPSPTSTATPAVGLTSPQLAPFRQMTEAVNRGDVAAAMAVFTDDVIWERGGQCPPTFCKGIQTVQRELTRDVGAHHLITLLSADTVGNAPRVRLELRTDGTRRGGVERIIQFFTLELRGEKIAAVRVSFDTDDAVTAAFVASQAGTQR